jgi:putative copper resistance protein D
MVAATSGSPGVYGKVLFSAHMVQHMTIALAVPTLLVFGAPVTLALRTIPGRRDGSRGPREWLLAVVSSRVLGALGHPVVAAGLFIAALNVFYYTPLLELSMRTHTGHVLMTTHFLLSGYLLASAIVGVDPGPSRPPHVYRMVLLMATFGFHALFSVALMSSTQILGEEWFSALGRDWGNTLAREQYLGGAIGWALGDYPVAMMAIALALDWIRSDEREQRRYDRQANRDNDAALAAYNAHLGRLAARNTPATTATGPITGERRDLEGTGHG